MIIALCTERTDSWQNPPIWGDERLARDLQQVLVHLHDIERVDLLNKTMPCAPDVDVCLRFQSYLPQTAPVTLLWYQNDHDYDLVSLADQYDGLLLASTSHGAEAERTLGGYPWTHEPVVCANPDRFPVCSPTDHYPVVYLGNNIKGPERTGRFLAPAIPYGLALFGSYWSDPPYAACNRGAVKGLASNNQVYRNADVVLSFHLQKHADWSMPVCRITEALLCERIVISDKVGCDLFTRHVVWTEGGADLSGQLGYWLNEATPEARVGMTAGARGYAVERFHVKDQAVRVAAFCRWAMREKTVHA